MTVMLVAVLLAQDAGVTCRAGVLPDTACTPGAVSAETVETVCTQRTGTVRHVTMATKKAVLKAYAIAHREPGEYEIDHLVSLELGGTNDQANLWPEAAEPRPGFHEKDVLENRLHALVCAGKLSLADAQQMIRTDWVAAYHRFVEP